jgi:SAM-dependent methyltransferase
MDADRSPAQVYDELFVPALFEPCARELLDFVPLREGERVLDVACGTGVVARAAAGRVGERGHVTAVDLRAAMIAVAASRPAPAGAGVAWREGDAQALDLPDASFDAVLCQHGLQFFSDPARAVREMRRVAAPGGRVGVSVWRGLEANNFMRRLVETEARHLAPLGIGFEDTARPFLFGDPEWLRSLLGGEGLGDVRVESRRFEARFAASPTLVRDIEHAYSAVVPEFAANPNAFAAFVAAVERDMQDELDARRDGPAVVFWMRVNLAAGSA